MSSISALRMSGRSSRMAWKTDGLEKVAELDPVDLLKPLPDWRQISHPRFRLLAASQEDFEVSIGQDTHVPLGPVEVPAPGFSRVIAADLPYQHRPVGILIGRGQGIGSLGLIPVAEPPPHCIDAGRKPVIDFCRWNLEVESWPSSPLAENPDYVPTPDSPLVYHVFGVLNAPESIVITEDDYFDFLAAVASNSSLIPTMVLDKMVFSSLLFMGFGPEDWDMRVLLRSLLSRETARKRSDYKHVAAVINLQKVESPKEARSYVENYFESFRQPPIHVFWSSLGEFCVALKRAWESAE